MEFWHLDFNIDPFSNHLHVCSAALEVLIRLCFAWRRFACPSGIKCSLKVHQWVAVWLSGGRRRAAEPCVTARGGPRVAVLQQCPESQDAMLAAHLSEMRACPFYGMLRLSLSGSLDVGDTMATNTLCM